MHEELEGLFCWYSVQVESAALVKIVTGRSGPQTKRKLMVWQIDNAFKRGA